MSPVALEAQDRVHQMLEHPGAGDGALLGDVADQHQDGAVRLGRRREQCGALPHLGHRSRRRLHPVGAHGLDRIDQDQRRTELAPGLGQPLDPGLGESQQRIGDLAQALRAKPDLLEALLTGHVEHPSPPPLELDGELQGEGRLPDPRLPGQEQHGAGHQAAAQHPVELGDAGRQAR